MGRFINFDLDITMKWPSSYDNHSFSLTLTLTISPKQSKQKNDKKAELQSPNQKNQPRSPPLPPIPRPLPHTLPTTLLRLLPKSHLSPRKRKRSLPKQRGPPTKRLNPPQKTHKLRNVPIPPSPRQLLWFLLTRRGHQRNGRHSPPYSKPYLQIKDSNNAERLARRPPAWPRLLQQSYLHPLPLQNSSFPIHWGPDLIQLSGKA